MRKHDKTCRVYVCFMDLEKAYDRVNREALWQALRRYDVGGKLSSGINRGYVNSGARARVNGGESERLSIDSGVRQGFILSPWLFNVYMDAMVKDIKMGMGEEGSERRLPSLLYAEA